MSAPAVLPSGTVPGHGEPAAAADGVPLAIALFRLYVDSLCAVLLCDEAASRGAVAMFELSVEASMQMQVNAYHSFGVAPELTAAEVDEGIANACGALAILEEHPDLCSEPLQTEYMHMLVDLLDDLGAY